jgi:CRISPR/Cas system-associated endonuclease Cas3-HD
MLKISDITIRNLESGRLEKELPEFYELKKVIENNLSHNNESSFRHTLTVLRDLEKFLKNNKNAKLKKHLDKKVDIYKRKNLLFLAAVLHDLGKKETIVKNGKMSSFPKHEKISILKAKNILKNFDLSKKEKNIIFGIIGKHSDLHSIMEKHAKDLEKQFDELMKSCRGFSAELVIMVMVDTISSYLETTKPREYKFRMNFYKEKINSGKFKI